MPALEITTKIGCTVNCAYCPQAVIIKAYSQRSKQFEMSIDVFEKCLAKLPREVEIHFSGMCEPWLNPEATQMLLQAHRRRHPLMLYTTLMEMDLSDVELLETVPFKVFNIHLPSSEKGCQNITVNDHYLTLLNHFLKSNIYPSFRFHAKSVSLRLSSLVKKKINKVRTHTRAGNIRTKARTSSKSRKGRIDCLRRFRQNVLLPNGDVVLCCMDYGLQHVLGNLLIDHYEDLFLNKEFLKIKSGQKDETSDILCRHCDGFAISLNPLTQPYFYIKEALKRFGELKIWNP